MNLMQPERWIVLAILVAICAGPALAQTPTIDYYGYGWEDGGFPPSDPGDMLSFTAVADNADALFGVDLGVEELTFCVTDLVSTGEIPLGGGTTMTSYVGGNLYIYRDSAMNADWGINPPNATSPASFCDGVLFFHGAFTNFTLFVNSASGGAFDGKTETIGSDEMTWSELKRLY